MNNRLCVFVFLVTLMSLAFTARSIAASVDSSDHLAEQIVDSKIPVLVDFWAPWCMPCHMVTPIIKEIKKDYAGRINVMKINVDVHRRIAAHFKVMSIPAVFVVKDRKVVKYLPGVQSKETYIAALEEALATPPVTPETSHGPDSEK